MFLFYLIQSSLFSLAYVRISIPPSQLSHATALPLLSLHPPMALQSSLNLHQPPHQHQSQQIKVASCPFSYRYSLPPDRSTDVCFYPRCLGDKMWHISPHSPSVTPFVTACIFLYEITVLIGEIVVYGRGLEFQEIMEGMLCTDQDRKSLGNGEQSYLHNDNIHVWTMRGRVIVNLYRYMAIFSVCASKMFIIDVEIRLSCDFEFVLLLCITVANLCCVLCLAWCQQAIWHFHLMCICSTFSLWSIYSIL